MVFNCFLLLYNMIATVKHGYWECIEQRHCTISLQAVLFDGAGVPSIYGSPNAVFGHELAKLGHL
jgi:hypothetical protein